LILEARRKPFDACRCLIAFMRLPLVLALTLVAGGCRAARPAVATQPTPPVDVSARLTEADGLVEAGCFDCLRDALSKYQAIRGLAGAPAAGIDEATAGAVRAAGLLAIRQRELGMIDDGYLAVAKDLLAQRSCGADGCQGVSQVLDIVDLLPTRSAGVIMRVPGSDAEVERLQQYVRNRPAWLARLRDAAGQDALTAYAWLAFICGTADGIRMRLDDVLAPVGAMKDLPLLLFKQAGCFGLDRTKLEAVMTRDPRFIEVTFLLGQLTGGQRLLDEAEAFYEQAYAWHPRWPILTLSPGLGPVKVRVGSPGVSTYGYRPEIVDATTGEAVARRMLVVLYREREPEMEIVGVEQPFDVPLIDLDTGEVLDRALVGTLDLLERDAAGGLVVVDLKTSARKYSDLQVEASLQLSVYSYATQMNGLADEQDLRLRFDVLTKTKQPELCRYWTTRDRAANVRLFRLAAEVLQAIEAGVFHPNPGWQCKDCQFRSQCWAWR